MDENGHGKIKKTIKYEPYCEVLRCASAVSQTRVLEYNCQRTISTITNNYKFTTCYCIMF